MPGPRPGTGSDKSPVTSRKTIMKLNERTRVDLRKHQKAIDGVKAAVVALAATATFLAVAPVSHADSTDDAFLSAMHRHGIHNDHGDAAMINFAHMVCEALEGGYSMNSLFGIGDLYGKRLAADDVRFLVLTSAAAYCPQYIR
jgi:hypothetical protein